MRRSLAFVAAVSVSAAACAQGTLPAVTAGQAVAAARDCATATSSKGVDAAVLLQSGWQQANLSSGAGEPVETDLVLLGKEGSNALVMAGNPGSQANGGCTITGGLSRSADFDDLLKAFTEAFESIGINEGNHLFRMGRDVAVVSQTGTGHSFRIVVIEPGDS